MLLVRCSAKPSTPTNSASTSNPHSESVGIGGPCPAAGIRVDVSVTLNMYGDAAESDCVLVLGSVLMMPPTI